MDLYAENILDHYRHPRAKQPLTTPTVKHEEVNLSCGDTIALELLITDGHITDVGWTGTGCAISQAAMSMLSEELVGKSLAEMDAYKKEDIMTLLSVPIGARRTKCALLSLHVLKNALHAFRGETMQGWADTVGNS